MTKDEFNGLLKRVPDAYIYVDEREKAAIVWGDYDKTLNAGLGGYATYPIDYAVVVELIAEGTIVDWRCNIKSSPIKRYFSRDLEV